MFYSLINMVKFKNIRYALLLIVWILHIPGFAQTQLMSLPNNSQGNNPIYLIEKAYLHLDKNFYAPGDTIWFKAYLMAGSIHQLSAISNVLNVELVNDRDSVKQLIK